MGHSDSISRWREYSKNKGWSKTTSPAPHEWLIEKMGIEVPPAIFWSAWVHGLLAAVFFGVSWGTFMHFTAWSDRALNQIAIPSIVCGIFFGLVAAIFHSYQRRKLGPITWNEFIKKHLS
ncbi:MAG: DUF6404 family protein [Bdellovibrionales bacterium]